MYVIDINYRLYFLHTLMKIIQSIITTHEKRWLSYLWCSIWNWKEDH